MGGRFEITGVPGGTPFLLVFNERFGLIPTFVEVGALEAGATVDVGDVRWSAPRAVFGTVVDDRGAPVANAKVRLVERWCWGVDDVFRTDGAGRFRVPLAPSSPIRVRIDADGFPPQEAVVDDSKGPPGTPVRLARGGVLRGRVLGPEERPVARATLSIRRPASPIYDPTRGGIWSESGADGTFAVPLAAGTYSLEVWGPRSHPSSAKAEVLIREGQTTTQEIRLP